MESELGKGSTLYLTVVMKQGRNLADSTSRGVVQACTLPEEQPMRLRILLAESNPGNQRLALRLFEKRGRCVILAANGREALEAAEKETYDWMLVAMQSPELDGFETTVAIRDQEKSTIVATCQSLLSLLAPLLEIWSSTSRQESTGASLYRLDPRNFTHS